MMDEDGYLMDEGGWIKWGWWIRVVFMEMLSFASSPYHVANHYFALNFLLETSIFNLIICYHESNLDNFDNLVIAPLTL